MKQFLVLLLAAAVFASCGGDQPTPPVNSPNEIKGSGQLNSSLGSNPVTSDTPTDPSKAAKIVFEEEVFDFGALQEGEKVKHIFKFKNVGESPLIISSARGSCGCTVPQWPKEPIAAGASGEILVEFNSKGKRGSQEKMVTLQANTIPPEHVLRIRAEVASNEEG